MKTLGLLLLLVAVLGGAWWKLTYPDATIEEARAQALASTERVQRALASAWEAAREALLSPEERVGDEPGGPDDASSATALGGAPANAASGDDAVSDLRESAGQLERRVDDLEATTRAAVPRERLAEIERRLEELSERLDALVAAGASTRAAPAAADEASSGQAPAMPDPDPTPPRSDR